MTQPATKNRVCHDDPSVCNDEKLWRRVHGQLVRDEQIPGGWRPMSGVFVDSIGEMSVNRAHLSTIAHTVAESPGCHIAELAASEVRELGYNVYADPLENNPAHAIICPKMKDSHARKLAKRPRILVHINRDTLPDDTRL
jgi:hypothetical protein